MKANKVPKKLKDSIGSYGLSNEMMGMYKAGKTVKEISECYRLNWQSVHDRLERLTTETGENLKINVKQGELKSSELDPEEIFKDLG